MQNAANWAIIVIFVRQGCRQGGGLRGLQPPPTKKERKREKKKRGIKGERKLNQSFQEHVVMDL